VLMTSFLLASGQPLGARGSNLAAELPRFENNLREKADLQQMCFKALVSGTTCQKFLSASEVNSKRAYRSSAAKD
jgi:hypothetical protein